MKIAGVDVQSMGTYHAEMKADVSIYGECPNSAILMAADGGYFVSKWCWQNRDR